MGVRREWEVEVARLQEREKELQMVERLDTEILAYRVSQLVRLMEKKIELKKKLAEMNQPAALPGHLDLQAAYLSRDGPGLLLRPPDHHLDLALPGQLPVREAPETKMQL